MATRKKRKPSPRKAAGEPVPFVIDYDLYEASLRRPNPEELAAVATALYEITPDEAPTESLWGTAARLQALRRPLR